MRLFSKERFPRTPGEAHPGPPTVEYASIVDLDVSTVEVSFGGRLALVFTIWGEGQAITVRTIEESHVELVVFQAAFERYALEAEAWAHRIREMAIADAVVPDESRALGE